MVDMDLADAMIVCGVNVSSDVDEIEFSGLTPVAGQKVGAVGLAESPCFFECRVERIIDYARRSIVVGEVLHMHVEDCFMDTKGRYVDPARYQPIARLHADNYITSDRQFELKKPAELQTYENGRIAAATDRAAF